MMEMLNTNGSKSLLEPCVCGCCDAMKCGCDFSRFLDMKPNIGLETTTFNRKSKADSSEQLLPLKCKAITPSLVTSDDESFTDFSHYEAIIDISDNDGSEIGSDIDDQHEIREAAYAMLESNNKELVNCPNSELAFENADDYLAGNYLPVTSSPAVLAVRKMVLISDLPPKEMGNIGDVVSAFVTHVESPGEFYVVPEYNFTCGNKSIVAPSEALTAGLLLRLSFVNEMRNLHDLPPLLCGIGLLNSYLDRYISRNKDFRYNQYQEMISKLSCYMEEKFKMHQEPNYLIGEAVAVKVIIQGKEVWMRGNVLIVHYSDMDCEHLYEVQLIDHGRIDIVPWTSVAGLPQQFASIQSLAYRCKVGGIKPAFCTVWGITATNKFKELLGSPEKDVLVEIALLESNNQGRSRWPDAFEGKPYSVDINVMDEHGHYVSNIGHELTFRAFHTPCAVSIGSVPWFCRLNVVWGVKKWKHTKVKNEVDVEGMVCTELTEDKASLQ